MKVLDRLKKQLSLVALFSLVAQMLFMGATPVMAADSNTPTTTAATFVTSTTATVNGIVGTSNADNTSFWWGTSSIGSFTSEVNPSSQLGDWSRHDTGLGAKSASAPFSYALTGLTPSTPYHFVAWSLFGGIWYPGAVLNFTTDPAPAPILTLTVPAARTITRSALVAETSGTPTGGNAVVNAATNGLAAIPVTLANTGNADSANVRISPIGANSHIQLWAKDTSGNYFDINVTGWIGSAGKSIPAGISITTDVYAISDTTGDYPLTVNLVNAVGGATVTSTTGTVTVTPIIHTQADFTAFDGVNIETNSYTESSDITATYIEGDGSESNPVKLTLTGYAPIVIPWFGLTYTTYNYVTVGIKLPTGFTGTYVYQTGIMRYDVINPAGAYKMGTIGDGSTPLATAGDALGDLDYSFAANSPNTKKEGLVKLKVIWTEGATPEYFTIDINGLQLAPDVPAATLTANGVNISTNGYTNSETFTFNLSSADATRYQLKYWNDIVSSHYKEGTPWNSTALSVVYPDSFTQGEGTHYFAFSACNAGNAADNCSAYSTPFIVTYDKTAPVLTITSPTAGQVINGRIITINGTATDTNFNYYYCYVEDSHGEVGARDAACTTTWHAVTPTGLLGSVTLPNDLADGNYVVHLIGYDKAMNAAETTQSFVLDNTLPTGSANYTGGNKVSDIIYLKLIDELNFNATFTDNQALEHTSYAVWKADSDFQNRVLFCGNWNNAITSVDISGTSTSVSGEVKDCSPTGDWSNGSYVILHIVYDAAGNTTYFNNYPGQKFVIDNTPPSVDAGANVVTKNLPNSLNATVDATVSGVASYLWEQTAGPGSVTFSNTSVEDPNVTAVTVNGAYTLRLTVIDNAGNSNSDTLSFTYDTAVPVMSNIKMFVNGSESSLLKSGDTVRIEANVSDPSDVDKVQLWFRNFENTVQLLKTGYMTHGTGDQYSFEFTAPATYEGNLPINENLNKNYLIFRTYDGLGNFGYDGRTYFTIDNTAPIISAATPISIEILSATHDFMADVSAIDGGSGLNGSIAITSNDVDLNLIGTYHVTYEVSDKAGNVGTKIIEVNVVDTTPPLPIVPPVAPAPVTFGNVLTPVAVVVAPQAVEDTTPAAVQGAQVADEQVVPVVDEQSQDVKGETDSTDNDQSTPWYSSKVLGIAIWLWLLLLAIAGGLWWFLAYRRRNQS